MIQPTNNLCHAGWESIGGPYRIATIAESELFPPYVAGGVTRIAAERAISFLIKAEPPNARF